jgi:hypothetical protein
MQMYNPTPSIKTMQQLFKEFVNPLIQLLY